MRFLRIATYKDGKHHPLWIGPKHLLGSTKRRSARPLRDDLFSTQRGMCAYCERPIEILPSANCDCDHIIPVKVGGPTTRSNLHLLCVQCHRSKSSMERRIVEKDILVPPNLCEDNRLYVCDGTADPNYRYEELSPGDLRQLRGLHFVNISLGTKDKDVRVKLGKRRKNWSEAEDLTFMTEIDTLGASEDIVRDVKRACVGGKATPREFAFLRKHAAQKYFPHRISGQEVQYFEKHQRRITNSCFFKRFNEATRKKLLSNMVSLGGDQGVKVNDILAGEMLADILTLLGFKGMQDYTTTIVWHDLSQNTLTRYESMVDKLHSLRLGVRIRIQTNDKRAILVAYLKKILGVHLYGGRQRGGEYRRYRLQGLIPKQFATTRMYDDWLRAHCSRFDKYEGKADGREYAALSLLNGA